MSHDHQVATLADVSTISDSPLIRAMSSEEVSIEAHDGLAAVIRYEEMLD
jgi:hypothetical protein